MTSTEDGKSSPSSLVVEDAADVGDVVKEIDREAKFTECFLCSNIFSGPKMLPCMHTFCLDCLEQFVKTTRQLEKEDDSDAAVADGGLSCPRCQRAFSLPPGGVAALPRNSFFARLATLRRASMFRSVTLSETEGNDCDVCSAVASSHRDEALKTSNYEGEDGVEDGNSVDTPPPPVAAFQCLDCDEKLCDDCSLAHRKQKLSRTHRLIPFGTTSSDSNDIPNVFYDENSNDKTNNTSSNHVRTAMTMNKFVPTSTPPPPLLPPSPLQQHPELCERHPNEAGTFFCTDCSLTICERCRSGPHSAHVCTDDVTAAAAGARMNLDEDVERIDALLLTSARLTSSIAAQQTKFLTQIDVAETKICEAADALKAVIDAQRDQLIADARVIRTNTLTELDRLSVDIAHGVTLMENLRELSAELKARGMDAEVASFSGKLRVKRKQLEGVNHAISVCTVKFRPASALKGNLLGRVAILDIGKIQQVDSGIVVYNMHFINLYS